MRSAALLTTRTASTASRLRRLRTNHPSLSSPLTFPARVHAQNAPLLTPVIRTRRPSTPPAPLVALPISPLASLVGSLIPSALPPPTFRYPLCCHSSTSDQARRPLVARALPYSPLLVTARVTSTKRCAISSTAMRRPINAPTPYGYLALSTPDTSLTRPQPPRSLRLVRVQELVSHGVALLTPDARRHRCGLPPLLLLEHRTTSRLSILPSLLFSSLRQHQHLPTA